MALAALGLVICTLAAKDFDKLSLAKDWQSTKGAIMQSSIVRLRIMRFPSHSEVHPEFVYRYEVDGQPYEGRDVNFDKSDEASVGKIVSQYAPGTAIDVHYRATDPAVSYFDHEGVDRHSLVSSNNLLFLVGLTAIVLALIFTVAMKKR